MTPTVENRFWRDPALPGLEIRHTQATGFSFQSHTHETYSVGVMEQGGSWVFRQGRGPRVLPGQTMLLPPGLVHAGMPVDQKGLTYRLIYVEQGWIRSLAEEIMGGDVRPPEFPQVVVDDPHLAGAMRCLSRMVAKGAPDLAKETAAMVAFSWLLARHGDPVVRIRPTGREPRAVRLAMDYLDDRVADKVSLDELAQISGLSRYHFLRVFKRATGLPPHAYQNQLRLDRARRLLSAGRPIADVALETGFTDQSHFSNAFKRCMGMTPSQYRQA